MKFYIKHDEWDLTNKGLFFWALWCKSIAIYKLVSHTEKKKKNESSLKILGYLGVFVGYFKGTFRYRFYVLLRNDLPWNQCDYKSHCCLKSFLILIKLFCLSLVVSWGIKDPEGTSQGRWESMDTWNRFSFCKVCSSVQDVVCFWRKELKA